MLCFRGLSVGVVKKQHSRKTGVAKTRTDVSGNTFNDQIKNENIRNRFELSSTENKMRDLSEILCIRETHRYNIVEK